MSTSSTYTIRRGDTLSKIAKDNGTTVDELAKDNNIKDPNKIYAGKTLNLPDKQRASTGGQNTGGKKSEGGFSYDNYTESSTVREANALLEQQLAAKPGAYQSQWQGKVDSIINSILNREDFSYDVNSDALYQQYKDQYTSLGKLAMQDTMGQAAAMTGGYGSSYATTAGNQAYQSYLSQLNEVVPELYGMALDKYTAEGNELYNQYSLLANQENQDYARNMDEYNTYLTERDYLTGRYDSERAFDYGVYSDDKSYAYNDYRNAIADEQWQKQYDESIRQYNEQFEYTKERDKVADSQYAEQMAFSKQQYADNKNAAEAAANLQHVATLSSTDLVTTMGEYSANKDNKGLASFLDDCVATGRLTPEQADEYYEKYMLKTPKPKALDLPEHYKP